MTTTINQLALVRTATARYQAAVTIRIESGDTCSMLILGDEENWEDGVPAAYYARMFAGIAKGTGVGEWQPVAVTAEIAAAIATAVSGVTGYATEGYVDDAVIGLAVATAVTAEVAAAVAGLASSSSVTSAIAAAISGLAVASEVAATIAGVVAGSLAVPAAGSSVSSPALATSYHPTGGRPTRVNVYCDVALASALLAAQSATVQMQAGSSTNPSTAVAGPQTATSGALNPGPLTIPMTLSYDLPAGHYYQIVKTAGAGAVTITRIEETPL